MNPTEVIVDGVLYEVSTRCVECSVHTVDYAKYCIETLLPNIANWIRYCIETHARDPLVSPTDPFYHHFFQIVKK